MSDDANRTTDDKPAANAAVGTIIRVFQDFQMFFLAGIQIARRAD